MKKTVFLLFFSFTLSCLFALPWVDEAFLLVETETPKKILHAIETDYSFKDFTRYSEEENLLMAALKNARGNDVIDLLLKKAKISPDSKTKNDVTAFMYACQYETDIEAVENMLETGAKSDKKKAKRILTKDKNGLTSFDYARMNEFMSSDVLALLKMYADEPVFFTEEVYEEPAEETSEEILPATDSLEGTINITTEELPEPEPLPEVKNTLMDFSSLYTPEILPESIYLYDYADDKYASLEIPAALIAAEEAARKFIPDANKKNAEGKTKLMIASKKGDITLIENLLYSGAEINARDEDGWTALMYAARFQKNPDVTKLLLYKGADREIKNKYGLTALMLAAGYSSNSSVVSLLLASYEADSDEARSALAYGISNLNKVEVLQAFIDKKVPLNIPYDGKTPLMLACQTGKNTELIDWLLKNGASKYQVEAATGKTAYDYARENKKLPHNVIYWSLNPNS